MPKIEYSNHFQISFIHGKIKTTQPLPKAHGRSIHVWMRVQIDSVDWLDSKRRRREASEEGGRELPPRRFLLTPLNEECNLSREQRSSSAVVTREFGDSIMIFNLAISKGCAVHLIF